MHEKAFHLGDVGLGSRLIDLEPEQDGRCEGNRR
jgi:hypothetical protein